MSALDESVKKHHPSCGIFQSPIWDCNCGADKAKVELEALRTRITEQEARIAELEKIIKLAIEWRKAWFDEGDLRELENGCKCEKCKFVTELDWLVQKAEPK